MHSIFRYLLVAVALAFAGAALGGAHVNPVRIDVDASGRGVITLTHVGERRATYQVTPYAWSILANDDALEPTAEFIASPAAVTLEPGQARTIRVGFRNPQRAAKERTFRLLVRELPDAQPLPPDTIAIATVLELSIPVFIAPAKPVPGELAWSLRAHEGALVLRAENSGAQHVQVRGISLTPPGAAASLASRELRYVLAGTVREWRFPAPASKLAGGAWRLTATTGRGPVTAELAGPLQPAQ